ncbi:RnfABCDGE type electron transport complex subunit D [bacterium]|nr:RnfABCDGE type electron transport complex subunit D [candidate division CSSED10-310 bacterium]
MNMKRIVIASSPHIHSEDTLHRVMYDVVIALIPAMIISTVFFGLRVLAVMGIAVISAVLFEAGFLKLAGHDRIRSTAFDGSAIIAGLLLAFNVPPTCPFWIVIIGSFIAIVVTKHTFGGLGYNLFNPALVGRIFLLISFPVQMTAWTKPTFWKADALSGATPLGVLKTEGLAAVQDMFSIQSNFIGTIPGCLGEISAAALLIGAGYLLVRKVISWHIPVFFLGTLAVFTGLFWLIDSGTYANPLFHIVSGGAILGAFFMATDMVTSPLTRNGQMIFGFGCGLLTGIIRLFGGYPEGVAFAILLMNATVPLIDRYTEVKKVGL